MNVSTQNPQADLLPEDYENIDRILATAEEAMTTIASNLQLRGTRIERWRWDVPEVRASWDRAAWDDLDRNVIFLVEKSGDAGYRGIIDINAWRDESSAGIATQRMWKNQTFDDVPVSPESNLTEPIQTAFATVLRWDEEQLDRHHLFAGTP